MSAHSFLNSRKELSFSDALVSWLDFDALASLGPAAGAPTLKLFFGGGGGISSSSSSRSSSLIKSSSSSMILLRAGDGFVGFLLLPPEHDKNQRAYTSAKTSAVFQDFPGPFMSIFHVFPGLFSRVDIKQVRFSYYTEYETQFIIILNSRSNRV